MDGVSAPFGREGHCGQEAVEGKVEEREDKLRDVGNKDVEFQYGWPLGACYQGVGDGASQFLLPDVHPCPNPGESVEEKGNT